MTTNNVVPRKHHLDRRADQIAAVPGSDDELLNTAAVAEWLFNAWARVAGRPGSRSNGLTP
jgi:hypothetical protein